MTTLFSWLRRLYSLDTLDTRFTSSASAPAQAAADTRPPAAKDARANAIAQSAHAPLWRTPEFFVYYLFFITLVPLMFKTVVEASNGACLSDRTLLNGDADPLSLQRTTPPMPSTRICYPQDGFLVG
jgi:hypothetical protein